MSKNTAVQAIPTRYLLEDYQVKMLEGKILTIIDALGLGEVQLKATKDLIKTEIRQIYNCPAWLKNEIMAKIEEERSHHPSPAF